MTPTLNDELEDARKKYLAAETHWRALLRKHDIEQNRHLVGRFFRGYDNDRDCDRYIYALNIDVFGHPIGNIISFYDTNTVEIEFNTVIKNDLDVMDEISMRDYVECLLKLNAKISHMMDNL